MTENDRNTLHCVSLLLEYPDRAFFARIPEHRACIEKGVNGFANPVLHLFLDEMEALGPRAAEKAYAAVFDYERSNRRHTWSHCGMKRERGRIRTFLNALCEESRPMPETFPSQGLRVFEFLSMCEDWAGSGPPDGPGGKRARLDERLAGMDAVYAPLFSLVAEALLREYAPLFHSAGARKSPAGPDMSSLGARGGDAHPGMARVPVPAVLPGRSSRPAV